MSQLKPALRRYLGHALGIDTSALDDDAELFSSGLIDALSVLGLVRFIERRAGVTIVVDAITLENFDSLSRIEYFVDELRSMQDAQRL
jgi:acyl carrier protein